MRLVDQLEIKPLRTDYHRTLVDALFLNLLQQFLEAAVVAELEEEPFDFVGSLEAAYGKEANCGPQSLVRNIFKLDLCFYGEAGTSELDAWIVYEPLTKTFAPRRGYSYQFQLWTPRRKLAADLRRQTIDRFIDDLLARRPIERRCPICQGEIRVIDLPIYFEVRCLENDCVQFKRPRGSLQ
ncbi:hypothetical protein [Blastopirellula marina]|uniref:Uncharacterized protein n=1 Tax=Blastopirellula marina TaxID=124 RepID=A0A2S8F286_9BACT|nr:hypothetical protein [Blastopirellula marina]PQO26250.1 hypothetical protein C5Y98_30865 [Blastopirellula marina]PTL40650.1 hypothetical protein C5Y97_30880 [Blastopirellula marina]